MTIDHIGYAVKSIERAICSFEKLGFVFGEEIDDTSRNVRIVFGSKDSYQIELVSPLDKAVNSPVDQYLDKLTGMPYHFCYRSDDLDADMENLCSQGFRVIVEPKPAVAFNNRRVVFMMDLGLGLLEIVES